MTERTIPLHYRGDYDIEVPGLGRVTPGRDYPVGQSLATELLRRPSWVRADQAASVEKEGKSHAGRTRAPRAREGN